MALTTNQYSVDGTAVLLVSDSPSGVRVMLHNTDQGAPVYINGQSTVTTVTGFRIDAKQVVQLVLNPSEQLWAIAGTGQNPVVAILKQTQYA
jgi:hypothetical protein